MNMKYLTIKRLRVQHANSMISYNSVGSPAITAHVGFAEAIAHRFNLNLKGVAILHHGQDHEGIQVYGKLSPNRVRGVPVQVDGKRMENLSLSDQPFAVSHYECSLILAFESDDYDEIESALYQHKFMPLLLSKFRFAGGVIVNTGGISFFDDLLKANNYLPKTGYWVMDRKDLLEKHNRIDGETVLDSAIKTLYPADKGKEDGNLWLSMSVVGYLRLNEFEYKEGVRQNLPHAYAEPMLGMIEYKNHREISSIDEERVFWKFVQFTEDSYVAVAQYI